MNAESSSRTERRFALDRLPWVVGAVALVVYLATLNHWVTLDSLALVSRVNGWDWQPVLSQPLLFLLTLPFRLLPAQWVPLALNAFTAACAALTLLTLARSVALLPHNRLPQQRELVRDPHALLTVPRAWIPIVLAAIALGLQLTFWEHAISASGEMLDLLVFACVVRCLLEHRLDARPSWLDRAALLFGAAMANNWAMAGFLPLFVVALVRTKHFSFFRRSTLRRMDQSRWRKVKSALADDMRFFLRMVLFGLAGLSLFLLPALVQSLSPHSALGFWPALQESAAVYEASLRVIYRVFFRYHRDIALLLAAGSLLPIFLLSIRWRRLGGGLGRVRLDPAMFIMHLAHAFLLALCLWIVCGAPFSPRQIGRENGIPLPFLTFYYLTALSIGYYSGFFLLFVGPAMLHRLSPRQTFRRALYLAATKAAAALPVLLLAGLLLVNIPAIRTLHAPHLDRYARLAADWLPPEGAVVLSDDPGHLKLLRAALSREGTAERYLQVETRSLPLPAYRDWLSRKYPDRWPAPAPAALGLSNPDAPLNPVEVVQLLDRVVQSNRVYCFPPAFGAMLNRFYPQPLGLIQEMKDYPSRNLSAPPLTPAELAANQDFWRNAIPAVVKPVLRLASQPELPRSGFSKWLMKTARLQTPPPAGATLLAVWYSRALNHWGVTLQRNNQWKEAASCFELALELNAENLPARLNLQCNSNLLARQEMTVVPDSPIEDQFGKYRSVLQLLADNGPFDEPNSCFKLGLGLSRSGMLRQACQQFERVKELAPNFLPARLLLADICADGLNPAQALRWVDEIKADPAFQPLGLTNEVNLTLTEAKAWFALTNRPKAEGIIYAMLATPPRDPFVFDRAIAGLMAHGSHSEAIRIIDRHLQLAPNDAEVLASKGMLHLLMNQSSNAIPPLTRALSLTNTYEIRRNLALAYLRAGQLDAAEAECKAILEAFPAAYSTYSGLAEIALQRKDTNAAIRYFKQHLAKTDANTDEARHVAAMLKSLQPGRR
ncbi:MAG TPA: hypothetical protein PKI20_12815 [Verrucomicrobiota bacterium]|nr:hypothetical protein [Verrucomicrobiota bacterium]HQL80152.1 hypothetical protein [Verrucomicrobiota bacterium]